MITRLDEIVDDEVTVHGPVPHYACWPECRAGALRIAERAYREGVHDALLTEWAAQGPSGPGLHVAGNKVNPRPVSVQPAPAEEKQCCWRHSTEGGPHVYECGDRRVGQRRKGLEAHGWATMAYVGREEHIRVYNAGNSLNFDRRSGNDRRTK